MGARERLLSAITALLCKSIRVLKLFIEMTLTLQSPGIGLGVVLSRAKLLTTEMLVAAVKSLASQAPALKDDNAGLLPDVGDVREISIKIAAAVIKQAVKEDLHQEKDIPTDEVDLEEWIREQMWEPEYRELKKIGVEGASRAAKGEAGSKGVHRSHNVS